MFIRELISNASDALEKLRHKLVSEGQALPDMEIHLQTDADRGTITIQVPPLMGRETGCLSVTSLGSQRSADHLELNIPQAPRTPHLLEGSSYLSSLQTSIHSLKPWFRCPCFQEVLSDSPSQCLQPGIPGSTCGWVWVPVLEGWPAQGQCRSWITERGVNPPGG